MARTPEYVSISATPVDQAAAYPQKRVSWGAVFAGVVLALALQAGFGMLGAGIGLSVLDPGEAEAAVAPSLGWAAGTWWIVSSLIAVFFGGWAAGHLSTPGRRGDGALHGVLAWAMGTIVMLYLLTSAMAPVAGGMLGVLGQASDAAIQSADNAAAPAVAESAGDRAGLLQDIRREAGEIFAGRAGQMALNGAPEAVSSISSLLAQVLARDDRSAAAHRALIDTLVTQGGMTADEARRTVADWELRYDRIDARAEQQGRQAAERSAAIAARAAWVGFIAMLLGIGTAALGGALAERSGRRAAVVYP